MIYDRMGDVSKASQNYQQAIKKCEEDPSQAQQGSVHYLKAMTNLAVALEKLGKREDSL